MSPRGMDASVTRATAEVIPLGDVSVQVRRSLRAAADAQRTATRTWSSVLDTRRRTRATIERSRRLRDEVQRARAARDGVRGPRDDDPTADVLGALRVAAGNLLVLAQVAGSEVAWRDAGEAGHPAASDPSAATAEAGQALQTRPPLTVRQLEILELVAEGVSTQEIARRLWLSVATVRNHVARTLRALDAHSRVEAIAKARRLGLL